MIKRHKECDICWGAHDTFSCNADYVTRHTEAFRTMPSRFLDQTLVASNEVRKAQQALVEANKALAMAEAALLDEVARRLRVPAPHKLTTGHTQWECVSPTGHCIYDNNEDRAHDDCLFCHQPEERK